MKIKRLVTENFRNLGNLDLPFDQDFVVFVGRNGIGKTSVLEAIYYSSLLLAFPPARTWEQISFDSDYFRITLQVDGKKMEYYYGKKEEKRYLRSQSIDGLKKKSSEFWGVLPCVSFLPQDLNLLLLSPSLRRDYLDEILLQTDRGYGSTLSDFNKTLTQRNELLFQITEGAAGVKELDFWDEKLFHLATTITERRQGLAEHINRDLEKIYFENTQSKNGIKFKYNPSVKVFLNEENRLLPDSLRTRDLRAGRTTWGPQLDDWTVLDENDRKISHYFSRGEQRSVMICLKLKEFSYIKESLGRKPVLLLDELFAELDSERKEFIAKNLPAGTQVFVTTTSLDELPEAFVKKAQVLQLQ